MKKRAETCPKSLFSGIPLIFLDTAHGHLNGRENERRVGMGARLNVMETLCPWMVSWQPWLDVIPAVKPTRLPNNCDTIHSRMFL